MDPSGQKPGKHEGRRQHSTDDDRKPPARRSSDELQSSTAQSDPQHNPTPQLPSMAHNESSSAAMELMRRLIENTGVPSGSTDAVSSYLERQLWQQQQHQQQLGYPIAATIPSTSTESKIASLQMQMLLKEQEESLRNTRLLLQRVYDESFTMADAVARRQTHTAPVETATVAAGQAVETPVSNVASEALWRQIRGVASTAVDSSVSGNGERSTDYPETPPLATAPPHPRAARARSNSQDTVGDADDTDSNVNSHPDAASICPDEEEMNDDEYFKDFDTEDSHKLNNETFPFRLYRMLFELEKCGIQDVVSFTSKGQVFVVHKPKRFVEVMFS
jgi:hypothetical protein